MDLKIKISKGFSTKTIDWAKLVTVGAVSLFLALAPVLINFPQIGQQALQLLSLLSNYNQGVTILASSLGIFSYRHHENQWKKSDE